MPNKMSDPNSVLMQMLMQMTQGSQPSSNIIKQNQPTQRQAPRMPPQRQAPQMQPQTMQQMPQQNIRPQGQMPMQDMQSQYAQMQAQMLEMQKQMMEMQKQMQIGSAQTFQGIKPTTMTATTEQRQQAHNLAMQFFQSKNQPFTQEQLQTVEEKILERIMGASKG